MSQSVTEFLSEHRLKKPISFHMPGHKGRREIYTRTGHGEFIDNIIGNDITEVPGADALFCPKGVIREVMDNYANQYGVKHTELLVNGSSAGVMASILTSVPRGGELVLGRNSHHSAFSALRLGDITPVYLRPQIDKKYNLLAAVSPEEVDTVLSENSDASAVLITSPNYYGVLSDIEAIAAVCRYHDVTLIVDQAHGAHLKFFDMMQEPDEAGFTKYRAAENLGADLVVNSTHKTLLSFTGTAILNICTDRIDPKAISEKVRMLQTTSPSYVMMGSLDVNEQIMSRWGREIIKDWTEDLKFFYRNSLSISGLTVVRGSTLDATKINLSMIELGLTGLQLEKELRYNNIWVEMVHGEFVMLMTGAGNKREDYVALLNALKKISDKYGVGSRRPKALETIPDFTLESTVLPEKSEQVPLYSAEGRVLYNPIITYPPGSPIACPGEVLSYEVISYISQALAHGDKISGVDDEGMISVGLLNL